MPRILKYDQIAEGPYLRYMEEWEASSEKVVPMSSDRRGRSFPEMLTKWRDDETDEAYARGFVPSTLYFYSDEGGELIGSLSYRHTLNERLLVNGGSIGYGVRPSERRKGHATRLLTSFLASTETGTTRRFLLTCDEANVASRQVIEAAGGVLQDCLLFEGTWTRRYWIELD